MIRGIIFDLDGVYFKHGTENFVRNVSEKYNIPVESVKEVYLRSTQMQEYKSGKLSATNYWDFAIQSWNIKATQDELLDLLIRGYEQNNHAIELVRKTRASGIKSMICSNNFRERIEGLQKRFKFLEDFDEVFLSYDYGVLKPTLLQKVSEGSCLKPGEILVIDDGDKIIAEAKRLGFMTILCHKPDDLPKYLEEAGVKI